MNQHSSSKDRQTNDLHRKLAMRRKAREDALREKQSREVKQFTSFGFH
jgi:hypothetical protein